MSVDAVDRDEAAEARRAISSTLQAAAGSAHRRVAPGRAAAAGRRRARPRVACARRAVERTAADPAAGTLGCRGAVEQREPMADDAEDERAASSWCWTLVK